MFNIQTFYDLIILCKDIEIVSAFWVFTYVKACLVSLPDLLAE